LSSDWFTIVLSAARRPSLWLVGYKREHMCP